MVMTESFNAVICDAGPIIHLDELGCLELLSDFQKILLPQTVSKEIKLHRPSALENPAINFTPCLHEGPLNEPLHTMCKTFSLDAGEIEALAVMEKNPAFIFLTDDASARLVADKMGFKVHGTIGILIRSIRREQMNPNQVLATLEELPLKSTLYIKFSLLDKIKRRLKEEFQSV